MKKKNTNKLVLVLCDYGLIIALCLIILAVSLTNKSFLTISNIFNILRQIAATGIMAVGVSTVIIAGHMDLSIESITTMAGVVCVTYVKNGQDVLGIILALLVGVGFGLLNGIIITSITSKKGRNGESFIITYGMQSAIAAAALLYTGGVYMNLKGGTFHSFLGKGMTPVIIFGVIAIILAYVMGHTPFGRSVYFLGGNEAAARMSGKRVKLHTILVFLIAGVCSAIAGIVLTARISAASSTFGTGLALDAIAGVVVGGTPLSGGKGSVEKTVLGVIVMGVLQNALRILNIDTYPQMMIRGAIIILAVLLDIFANRIKEREAKA